MSAQGMRRAAASTGRQASQHERPRALRRIAIACGLVAAFLFAAAGSAYAAAPVWRIDSLSDTTARPGGTFDYLLQFTNVGDADTSGAFQLRATLAPGLTAVSATPNGVFPGVSCTTAASSVTCDVAGNPGEEVQARATFAFRLVTINVSVDPGASGDITSSFEISGGGAPTATTTDTTDITDALPVFGIDSFDGNVAADAAGNAFTQAGGHPYSASTSIDFKTLTKPNLLLGALWPVEPTKDILVDLPPGFVGNPTAVDQCTMVQLANTSGNTDPRPLCPPSSQVGTVLVHTNGSPAPAANVLGPLPLFSVLPPSDVAARFGFNVLGTVVTLDARLRSDSDYGLSVDVRNISEGLAIQGSTLTFWGVPGDPSHDLERACAGGSVPVFGGPLCRTGTPRVAFLRNPTSCTPAGVGLPTTARIDSWANPGVFDQSTFISHLPPGYPLPPGQRGAPQGTTDCSRVPFRPTLTAAPSEQAKAGEPSGFAFDLALPQSDSPEAVGTADLKKAVVTLPAGVRVAPGSADGLQACTSGQIALRSTGDPTCPAGSKLGTVTIDTPLLERPMEGSIYLATPFDNPFNSLIAIYLVARGPGLIVKLPGQATPDANGRITTTFDNQPQLPFSRLHLEFKGGDRAPLAVPKRCGTYTTHSELTSWSGATVSYDSPCSLAENSKGATCPSTFSPGWSAGTDNPVAGSTSPFHLRVTRDDADQEIHDLTVNMPQGLLGYISRAELCGDVDAANGTCPEGSRIGSVTVGAGAGSNPFYITDGRAYLTSGYKGGDYGLSIVVRAVAGPFDLGTVVVRSAILVDKHDASLKVVSDPLPTILQGIPLDVRDVRVNVDKDGFIVNPTSCAAKSVSGTVVSTENAAANVSARFQVGECGSLGFKPRMVITVGGRGHTTRGRTTPFRTVVTMPQKNQANLRLVRVTLPKSINARLTVINDACTRAQYESDVSKCAANQAGTATATTPLLRTPLSGKVYFVKNGHGIPDLFVALRGDVDFDLIGRIDIVRNTFLRTTFDAAPDVPIRSFTLRLFGDTKNGSVGAAANLCSAASRKQKAQLDYIAQSGKVFQADQALKVEGCKKHKAKPKRKKGKKR